MMYYAGVKVAVMKNGMILAFKQTQPYHLMLQGATHLVRMTD